MQAQAEDIQPLTDALQTPDSATLGLALRTSTSLYTGGSTRVDLLPLVVYEGDRFFVRSSRAGIKLFADGNSNAGQRVDFFLERRLEGFSTEKLPASLIGMAKRDSGLDVGLSYQQRQSWGTWRAELLKDAGSASRGFEARLGYSDVWRSGRWSLSPDVALSWRDAKLNDHRPERHASL